RWSGDEGIGLGNIAEIERTDTFTFLTWVRRDASDDRMVLFHNSKPNWEVGSRGIECYIDRGQIEIGLSHFWPGNAIRVRTVDSVPPDTWTHVAIRYDGSSRADGLEIFLNGKPAKSEVVRNHLYSTIRFSRSPPFEIGARLSELGFRNGAMDEFALYRQRLTDLEIEWARAAVLEPKWSPTDPRLFEYFVERVDEACAKSRDAVRSARIAENKYSGGLRSIMVLREDPKPALARVLFRGSYLEPREEVSAGVPTSLNPSKRAIKNRLELAEWLTHRDHPLSARVALNRVWTLLFSSGLVNTLEDFGSQGEPPSHPELLDFLAAEFMEGGWDLKSLVRRIVTSATYRQASHASRELRERDPKNRLLARGPRQRLSAEQIRDSALKACGLLTEKVGGPSVKPYQPGGLWREVGPKTFRADSGDKAYRRSLYTFWKRTSPPPSMLIFDAVNREVCVARREITVTPSQALVLLNDPQFVEAARVLAADLLRRHGSNEKAALNEIFRRLTSRKPTAEEQLELSRAYGEQLEEFSREGAKPEAYVEVGPWPAVKDLPLKELAAMTAMVQLVMNFYEFQVKR
ncbi:MAG: DUF1553 domain-containing protein, partial [Planctomycetota bacterium]